MIWIIKAQKSEFATDFGYSSTDFSLYLISLTYFQCCCEHNYIQLILQVVLMQTSKGQFLYETTELQLRIQHYSRVREPMLNLCLCFLESKIVKRS